MKSAADSSDVYVPEPPVLPGWVRQWASPGTLGGRLVSASFSAGAALSSLHSFACSDDRYFPAQLWRQRLALATAQSVVRLQQRQEDEGALRDSLYLTAPGDDPGPAGRILLEWRELGACKMMRPPVWIDFAIKRDGGRSDVVKTAVLKETILQAADFALQRKSGVSAAAYAAAHILDSDPTDSTLALFIADAVLAKRLKWWAPVPLLASTTRRSHLPTAAALLKGDKAWLTICYQNYAKAAVGAFDLACDLQRRALRLQSCAPKLRAKGATRAVDILLTEDAVQPSGAFANRTGMSVRAARRVCDRLVSLQAIRELTGRPTHRLYGL